MSQAVVPHVSTSASTRTHWLNYRTIWRWHFYAGLFCIPFVLWLSVTGSIYLFKPQIDAWLDRPYEHLAISSPRASAASQVETALAAVPGSNLHYYQLPRTAHSAVQIIVGRKAKEYRVYVNPYTLRIMKVINEDHRFTRRIFYLHGELLMGDKGSYIVETAASWAIIMILTGLYLWWPRNADGLGGVLYPRLREGKRVFWRDIHAVTGMWVSMLALCFLLTGLPWAKSWGGYLKMVRAATGKTLVHEDWSTGRSSIIAQRLKMNKNSLAAVEQGRSWGHHSSAATTSLAPINKMIGPVSALHFAFPVLISPPMHKGGAWIAKSNALDRVLRDEVTLNPDTGNVVSRVNFSQRPLIDRLVGTGISAHVGHLYGWLNQAVNLCTALGLITLCLSAVVLWWRRRPEGALGAPAKLANPKITSGLIAAIIALAIYLPLFGLTLLLVALAERFLLRRIPAARQWLGLTPQGSQ